jgi:hypothetical protein
MGTTHLLLLLLHAMLLQAACAVAGHCHYVASSTMPGLGRWQVTLQRVVQDVAHPGSHACHSLVNMALPRVLDYDTGPAATTTTTATAAATTTATAATAASTTSPQQTRLLCLGIQLSSLQEVILLNLPCRLQLTRIRHHILLGFAPQHKVGPLPLVHPPVHGAGLTPLDEHGQQLPFCER